MPDDIPPLGERLPRLYWRAVDAIANAIELAKCWLADRLFGPFPETESDRAIRERGDRRFSDPGEC